MEKRLNYNTDAILDVYQEDQEKTKGIKIICEGKKDVSIYEKIKEFRDPYIAFLPKEEKIFGEQYDRANVIKKVSENENFFGIIDLDYSIYAAERIFQINMYSIESLILYSNQQLKEDFLKCIEESINIKEIFTEFIKLDSKLEGDKVNKCQNFILNYEEKEIEETRREYIKKNIKCNDTFVKFYMLKKPINDFLKLSKEHNTDSIFEYKFNDIFLKQDKNIKILKEKLSMLK